MKHVYETATRALTTQAQVSYVSRFVNLFFVCSTVRGFYKRSPSMRADWLVGEIGKLMAPPAISGDVNITVLYGALDMPEINERTFSPSVGGKV